MKILNSGFGRGFLLMMAVFLIGSGPCMCGLDDDCSNPGSAWCDGAVAKSCIEPNDNGAYALITETCGGSTTCVVGVEAINDQVTGKSAWCQEILPCTEPGESVCSEPGDGTEPQLLRCVQVMSAGWATDRGLVGVEEPEVLYVLDPVLDSNRRPVPCSTCTTSCGCGPEEVCEDGVCIPGALDQELTCCNRGRGEPCPNGAACENPDGSGGTCATVGRCEVCDSLADCEEGDCLSTGDGVPSVCLQASEASTYEWLCRQETQVWLRDACGTWTENVEDCGSDAHCEDGGCVLNVPEIEVSPMLLEFGQTTVGQSKTLTLLVGNTGYAPLDVHDVAVGTNEAEIVLVEPVATTVEVEEIVDVSVTFTPIESGSVSARLHVRSNDEDEPEVIVLMNGEGIQ